MPQIGSFAILPPFLILSRLNISREYGEVKIYMALHGLPQRPFRIEAPRGRLFRAQPMDLCLIRTCLLLRLRSSASPPRSYHCPLYLRGLAVPGAEDGLRVVGTLFEPSDLRAGGVSQARCNSSLGERALGCGRWSSALTEPFRLYVRSLTRAPPRSLRKARGPGERPESTSRE